MIRPISFAVIVAANLLSCAFAAEDKPVALETLAKAMRVQMDSQCQLNRQAEAAAIARSPMAVESARQGVSMVCDCMPAQFDIAVKRLEEGLADRLVPRDEFLLALRGALNACAARQLRQSVLQGCRTSEDPGLTSEQRDAYCQCMQAGLSKLGDDQIGGDAQTASERFQAKVNARSKGQPDPQFEPTASDKLDRSCRPGRP